MPFQRREFSANDMLKVDDSDSPTVRALTGDSYGNWGGGHGELRPYSTNFDASMLRGSDQGYAADVA